MKEQQIRSTLLLPLLFAVGGQLCGAPSSEYFRNDEVKSLVKKAEFWRGRLLNAEGHMEQKIEGERLLVMWGVGKSANMKLAREAAFNGARAQIKVIFSGKKVHLPATLNNKQIISFWFFVDNRPWIFNEVACWQKAGLLKRAFMLKPIKVTRGAS